MSGKSVAQPLIVDDEVALFPAETGSATSLNIAYGNGVYLVTWKNRGFYPVQPAFAARVSPAGIALDAAPIPIGDAIDPRVDFDGTEFFIATRDDTYYERWTRVHPVTGVVRTGVYDADPIVGEELVEDVVCTTDGCAALISARVDFHMYYSDSISLSLFRPEGGGGVLIRAGYDARGHEICHRFGSPRAVARGTQLEVVFSCTPEIPLVPEEHDLGYGLRDVFAMTMPAYGEPVSRGVAVGRTSLIEVAPNVACSESDCVYVWSETNGARASLRTNGGERIVGAGSTSLAFDGTEFILSWDDGGQWMAYLNSDGTFASERQWVGGGFGPIASAGDGTALNVFRSGGLKLRRIDRRSECSTSSRSLQKSVVGRADGHRGDRRGGEVVIFLAHARKEYEAVVDALS
ncbi:MAG: hypothetical protein AAGE52_34925, partial [Myxococcota bacterium]